MTHQPCKATCIRYLDMIMPSLFTTFRSLRITKYSQYDSCHSILKVMFINMVQHIGAQMMNRECTCSVNRSFTSKGIFLFDLCWAAGRMQSIGCLCGARLPLRPCYHGDTLPSCERKQFSLLFACGLLLKQHFARFLTDKCSTNCGETSRHCMQPSKQPNRLGWR